MRTVKILRLSHSSDTFAIPPPELRSWAIAERALSEASGEPVTTVIKALWPTPGLVAAVDRWLENEEPDVVFIWVSAYWYLYGTIAGRLRQVLPGIARPLSAGADQLGRLRWLTESRPTRPVKGLAERVIGTAPAFTPEESVAVLESVIRRVLVREECLVVVRGAMTPTYFRTRGQRRRAQELTAEVDRRMAELCRRLHLKYISGSPIASIGEEAAIRQPDRVHWNVKGHELYGAMEADGLVSAWRAWKGLAPGLGP